MTNPSATHLFISSAPEDTALAYWLARKLAAHGHAVWFEKMKTLGGEPWPQSVEDAIKLRSFRMLAIVSEHAWRKKKPALERMLAQRVIRQQNISDFLIPLKVDDSEPDELTPMESAISFEGAWAEGWQELLQKLGALAAPHSLKNGARLAAASFRPEEGLVNDAGEKLIANIVHIKSIPNVLRVFQPIDDLNAEEKQALESAWTFYETTGNAFVALIPPPPDFAERFKSTHERLVWAEHGSFHGVRFRDLAARIIMRALERRLLNAGCLKHPDPELRETFYLPKTFVKSGQLEFTNYEGKKIQMPIRSKVAFRRAGGLTEVNFHHFAFRVRLARGLGDGLYLQLMPTLVFFNESGGPIPGKSAASRLERITKTWGNEERLKRTMAAEQILTGAPPAGVNDPVLEPGLITLDSPVSVDEALLESEEAETVKADGDAEQEFELEEPEAGEENE